MPSTDLGEGACQLFDRPGALHDAVRVCFSCCCCGVGMHQRQPIIRSKRGSSKQDTHKRDTYKHVNIKYGSCGRWPRGRHRMHDGARGLCSHSCCVAVRILVGYLFAVALLRVPIHPVSMVDVPRMYRALYHTCLCWSCLSPETPAGSSNTRRALSTMHLKCSERWETHAAFSLSWMDVLLLHV